MMRREESSDVDLPRTLEVHCRSFALFFFFFVNCLNKFLTSSETVVLTFNLHLVEASLVLVGPFLGPRSSDGRVICFE
jgi:hypothetical protein